MRHRFHAGLTLAATLIVAACADQSQPTSPPSLGEGLRSVFPTNAPAACTSADNKIIQMGLGSAAREQLREGVAFFYAKQQTVQGWKKFIDILKHLDSDDPDVVDLTILLVQCGTNAGGPPANPAGNEDVFVGIILNPKKTHQFISSHNDFLAYFPANFFTGPVIVLGTRQFDNTNVNNEDRQEYPLKVDITASPPGMENESGAIKAIVKVCAYESDGEGGLHHPHPEDEGMNPEDLVLFQQGVGELDKPDPDPSSPLPCEDTNALFPEVIVTFGDISFTDRVYAASMRALRGAGRLAVSVLTPRPVFASAMFVDGGVGGETADFSSLFAPVEQGCGIECDFVARQGIGTPITTSPTAASLNGAATPPKVKK